MTAQQIAQLIILADRANRREELTDSDHAGLVNGLFNLADGLGLGLKVSQIRLQEYEAPANGWETTELEDFVF